MLNNPAATNSPLPSGNRFSLPNFKGKKGAYLVLLIIVVIAAILAYIATKNQINLADPFGKSPAEIVDVDIVDEETGELTEEFYENITDVTLDQIREASDSAGVNLLDSPTLSTTEEVEGIYEELGKDEIENHVLSANEWGISLSSIEIKQGDVVTWVNESEEPMYIIGEGWQNNLAIEPGEKFTYGFLYLGEYKYKINDKLEGAVIVVK